MKFKIALLSLLLIMIPVTAAVPVIASKVLPVAATAEFRSVVYIDSVSASGEVRRKDSEGVSLDVPVVLDKILVKRGQPVSEGEAVALVNKSATARRLMELNQFSGLASLGTGAAVQSYDDIINQLPDRIYSNRQGTVDSVNAASGDLLTAGEPVVTLIGSEDLEVIAYVSEKNISRVAVGQQVLITGSGFGESSYHGEIVEISPTAKKQFVGASQDTVIETVIKFSDADEKIRPGYSAKIQILTAEPRTVSLLPYEAVSADDDGNEFVYVFSKGTAVRRMVETGTELSDGIEIVSGVTPEDAVLTFSKPIKDGSYVQIRED